ncbi:hypothetical protein M409DRAFT_67874 [Zasmidium cellare ATCC 36951]|uniref:Transcription initiation factor TFIID subunit 2 n=1 Tax=Zasmidium cellare ATCC 36951 TaxID=1080233 RepID=A0A6A6CAW5_ZASCE|nr:uncharacterized protein M409DRAFT_67874 [Zasmidium cellare ATCC 36951]KAF2164337.1 hypothetical protein M409DRAFT_67874 [Zasmidium cellare ATCC 36951]
MEAQALKQRVDLDIDFPARAIKGSTEITVQPLVKDLKYVYLHCRQCRPKFVQAGGITAKWEYDDPYRRAHMSSKSTVHQHDMLKSKIATALRPSPEPQLRIALPPKLKIQELHVDPITSLPLYNGTPSIQKQENDAMAVAETPVVEKMQQQIPQFAPIKITVEFEVDNLRDGIHWVGCDKYDKRYPYLYTKLEPWPGNTSNIFPCVDSANSRCTWEIALRLPRTLGDAFRKPNTIEAQPTGHADQNGDVEMVNGIDTVPAKDQGKSQSQEEFLIDLSEEDAALELTALCVGDVVDDVADTDDDTRHTVTFSLNDAVTARHVGFAVGPFESVDLTFSRESDDETKLAGSAVKVEGFCLPGRADEVHNTCFPVCRAVDHITVNCGRFPFPSYNLLFADDLVYDTTAAAGLSICSTRLLFPAEILEPLHRNTRILVRAVADQWSGVNIIPKEPSDYWVIAGIAGYLTDVYMKHLSGNNQYRWEQKQASEKVYELDVDRPSIAQQGNLLHLDPSIGEFINLKSALVLGILDRRLIKSSGSTGVMRIINKVLLNARTGSLNNGELSTQDFQRTCEKLGHNKLESFFRQWVMGAGCPIFDCIQKFNKKKLVVEMTLTQRQLERRTKPLFEPNNFMREIKEHVQEVWAPEPQGVFTGPMTIRIHEADGTPYEHIVEIKEHVTKLEIPYNTKYKRLKRSKRQKERVLAEGNNNGEDGGDALVYSLGDTLDAEADMKEWQLSDWSKEDEEKMGQESYEWIRMDADFEWIGKIHLKMPLYMYISQLQQDRDIVAQYESMRYLLGSNPHHVSLTILIRTLVDERYFHGIRVMAANGLAKLARDNLLEIGQHHLTKAFAEMFCEEDGIMPRPNDFESRVTFIMQCAIPEALAQLRDNEGKVPKAVRQFFVDKLKFNDNSDNAFSDCHYVATLMRCLADSLVVSHRIIQPAAPTTYEFNFGDDEPVEEEGPEEAYNPDADFEQMAVDEIERYRRIDEWVLTYQNIYSTTAIECLQKLTKAGIVKDKTKELLQYTRPSTADNVRLEAFRCLNEIGLTKRMPMMKHLVYSIVDDHSPYFRERLLRHFGEALGHIAFGDDAIEEAKPPPPPPTDGLVLEQEVNSEIRKIETTKKTTPEGALAALKLALSNDDTFRKALWYAATSPDISLDEVSAFCEVAALIYEPVTSHTIMLKLPRPYRCVHEGRGQIRFYQQGNYRTRPSLGLDKDDYEALESYELKYSGPLAEETKQFIEKKNAEKAIKLRIQQAQEQIAAAQQTQAYMPPPALPTPTIQTVPTPTIEKTGFKLSLGGNKRKASVDLSSPKIAKIPKQTRPVVLNLGLKASKKAQEIISSPRQPGRGPFASPHAPSRKNSQEPSRPLTSASPQPPTPQAQPQPLNFNQPAGQNGFPANSPPPLLSLTGLTGTGSSLPSLSMSPPATTGDPNAMGPPKKKLTLKLSAKPNQSQ